MSFFLHYHFGRLVSTHQQKCLGVLFDYAIAMDEKRLNVKTVGVIGAGVSGIASAIHLRKAGLDVTVFERSQHVGGVW